MSRPIAKLALEDGTVFTGWGFGAPGTKAGEVVFNTSMTGYQEILTDPSYSGQIVTMTYPLIGNYGVTDEDLESVRPQAEGFIIKELSPIVSNFRATMSLQDYLAKWNVVAIEGIDTRALTRRLRVAGVMRGVLSTAELDDAKLVAQAKAIPSMAGADLVQVVQPDEAYNWAHGFQSPFALAPRGRPARFHVVAIDCGIKQNILRHLVEAGCRVTVLPPDSSAAQILAGKPDGVFLSNGPGDPQPVTYAVEAIRGLLGKVPIFGICLGCQLLGLSLGASTYKLKFGHRGGNQPVLNTTTGRVEITSQNHGFAVEETSLAKAGGLITHINLNDKTVEGFVHRELPAFAVQYHPEASPGPHDASYLFDCFIREIESGKPPTPEEMAAAQDQLK
ncbi:MAG: glutamine-hydrolyzing carbamoyl-phosphate synthase small subunit [Phycisphaerae bacterium]|nr:glutamine-hydrolyzing carbamoyl-phosphate synthase small subunit [Phycisphaerae bacterium]